MNAVQTHAPPGETWINYHLREMEPRDSAAYTQLMASSPDTGLITIQVMFKMDPYEMLMQRRIGQAVVVAETPDGRVVGTGAADARPIWFEGHPVQAVHMHSLLVAPDFRQHGVATALVQWRIQWAREHYGENVLIFAEIQQSNLASFRNAAKWATGFGTQRESGFLRTYPRTPKPIPGVEIREAHEEDYPVIAGGLNDFNHDVNFTRFATVDRLHRNLEPIHGQIFRHRYVVTRHSEIVGGAVLSAHDPSIETRIIKAPFLNRVIARVSGMIQTDNVIDGGEVDGIWFKPGHADDTHYLIAQLRHRAWPETRALNFTLVNPKAWEAVQVNHWMPHTILSVAYLRPPQLIPYKEK
ncbi:MAG TPA: GNAT family N-acetyltransferase [Aggregatilineales bacterium]|nr:GNAT family N-acetyltransferase [Aggregatilineales bacterium]